MRVTPTTRDVAQPPVATALKDCRSAFWGVALFSAAVNILMLAGPLYMLQVYDRVLASRSVPTLVALSLLLLAAFVFQGILDVIRSRVVVRVAGLLDRRLESVVHGAVVRLALQAPVAGDRAQPVRDLDQIRAFLTSQGPIAIVDLPWMPAFLLICFLIHPWLGALALFGAILLLTMALLTERASRRLSRGLVRDAGLRAGQVELDRRNSESIVAMGMLPALTRRWSAVNRRYLDAAEETSDAVGSYGSISKVLRLLLQSAMLGLGAYLVIRRELTAGAMIAASIMMARALAPIETAIANWRGFVGARESIRRLSEILARTMPKSGATELPPPSRSLDVERVTVAAPGAQKAILTNLDFSLRAGEVLGVIGPSGAGKTSIARTLVGVWRPARGEVRLDGASVTHWPSEALGPHLGYLSQSIELFDGTVAENIGRMAGEMNSASVIAAAEAAGAHDMVLRLPAGYDTAIGEGGITLSAGQRQRLALARALYGDPFFVVLDEPNSNLDNAGETALLTAVSNLKARGAIVVIIAHRRSALAVCDKLLFVADGAQRAFGPRDEVLRKILPQQAPAAANLKVVGDAASGGDR